MPKTVAVPVLKAFEYKGQTFLPGETVAMAPLEAVAAARRREVSLSRTYRTTAVKAGPAANAEPIVLPEASVEELTAPRRRRSRRRDMAAETLIDPSIDA